MGLLHHHRGQILIESNFGRSKEAKAPRDVVSLPILSERGPLYSSKREQNARFHCADQISRLLQQNHKNALLVDRRGATHLKVLGRLSGSKGIIATFVDFFPLPHRCADLIGCKGPKRGAMSWIEITETEYLDVLELATPALQLDHGFRRRERLRREPTRSNPKSPSFPSSRPFLRQRFRGRLASPDRRIVVPLHDDLAEGSPSA
jgi:hypothetical protein